MTEWRGFNLTFQDRLRSHWNAVRFWVRNRLHFRRGYYRDHAPEEIAGEGLEFTEAEKSRLNSFQNKVGSLQQHLSPASQQRTWSTLDLLHSVPDSFWSDWQVRIGTTKPKLLDAGCQDFSRAPGIQAFFRDRGLRPHLLGIELDAFSMLGSLHSRADRAEFFAKLAGESSFLAQDFFSLSESRRFDGIFCFYPFVSPHPALAWGLPYEFGDAEKWSEAITRHLNPGGIAFLVHQGDWEEAEFREAARGLKCVFSAEFQEVFEPHEHPSRIGLYVVGSASP